MSAPLGPAATLRRAVAYITSTIYARPTTPPLADLLDGL